MNFFVVRNFISLEKLFNASLSIICTANRSDTVIQSALLVNRSKPVPDRAIDSDICTCLDVDFHSKTPS